MSSPLGIEVSKIQDCHFTSKRLITLGCIADATQNRHSPADVERNTVIAQHVSTGRLERLFPAKLRCSLAACAPHVAAIGGNGDFAKVGQIVPHANHSRSARSVLDPIPRD